MLTRVNCKRGVVALLLGFAWVTAWSAGYPLRIEAVADEEGVWQVIAHNRGSAPVYVNLELAKTQNVRMGATTRSGGRVLEPGAREPLAEAIPIEPSEAVSFEWDVKWVFGRGNARGNHDGLYRPPFPGDLTFDTTNTASEHPTRERNAVDILMPPGTPIIAARSGWVMDVAGEEGGDRVEKGLNPAYITPKDIQRMGSYVRILHDDGTWAEYIGVADGSVKVTPGMKVEAGTQIALSSERPGAEPHMTFVVMKGQVGLGQPESIPIKMEMAGRGVVAVVAGNAMGASLSVAPTAKVTKADPLVIAQVEKGRVNDTTGVMAIRDKLVQDPTLLMAVLGAIAAVVFGVAGKTALKRKGDKTWAEWVRSWREKKEEAPAPEGPTAQETEDQTFEAASMRGDLRPPPGGLIADWESGTYAALNLAMKPGFQVHTKIAMNRLFARPTSWLKFPEARSQMRGESLDFAIVRVRDARIVAALDIRRSTLKLDWTDQVEEMRKECLAKANIKHIVLDGSEGPDELRRLLGEVTKDDVLGVRSLKVAA